MTFTKTRPISFGKLFPLFYKYWDMVSKRRNEYNDLDVIVRTIVIFMTLRHD